MIKLRRFKLILVMFFVLQSSFSILGEFFLNIQNIYPLYTWRIFHPRPDKYLKSYSFAIHSIDDTKYVPAKMDLNFVEKAFPNIRKYTFAKKIHEYGKGAERSQLIKNINELLVVHHKKVEWSVVEVEYNPIDYYWDKEYVQSREFEKHVATR